VDFDELNRHIDQNSVCKSVTGAADQAYSYVFVTTKAIPEITKTPDILKPLLSSPYADIYPQPTYVVVQNGLNVERELYEALVKLNKAPPRIIGTALYILANILSPNVVEHDSFVGHLIFLLWVGSSSCIGSTADRRVSTQRLRDDNKHSPRG
jgi:hypothetical protein